MKKKTLISLVIVMMIVVMSAMLLTACNKKENTEIGEHEHTFIEKNDSNYKWEECEKCGIIKNMRKHNYEGSNVCSECGHVMNDCFEYTLLDDGTYELTKFFYINYPNIHDITIPSEYKGRPVTSIGDSAFTILYDFKEYNMVKSITIPDSIVSIGDNAFDGCMYLSKVNLGANSQLTSIGRRSFYACYRLTEMNLSNKIISVGEGAFNGCYFLLIRAEAKKKPVGWDNNWNANDCPVIWDSKNNDTAENGNIYLEQNGVRYSLKDKTATLVFDLDKSRTKFDIPSSIKYKNATYNVTAIGANTFAEDTSLKSVTIPNGVTTIYSNAFYSCTDLDELVIPISVTEIERDAFSGCDSLTIFAEASSKPENWDSNHHSIIWNYGGKHGIDANGFKWASDKNKKAMIYGYNGSASQVNIPTTISGYNVTAIMGAVFAHNKQIQKVTIPEGIESIGVNAFSGCTSLTSIQLPNSVTSIGSGAFKGCIALTSVTLPNNITTIGYEAFSNCQSLANIVIPDSVTSIGESAFRDCSTLADIRFSKNLESIGQNAFNGCVALTNVDLPDGLTSIASYAFSRCTALKEIVIPSSVINFSGAVFEYCESIKIFAEVPSRPEGWGYINRPIIWNYGGAHGVTESGFTWAVDNNQNITIYEYKGTDTRVIVPSVIENYKVTTIGEDLFSECESITSIQLPSSIVSIGARAFNRCTALSSIAIPSATTRIGSSAFYGCISLTSIVIPSSVTSIDDYAFSECTSLTIFAEATSEPSDWDYYWNQNNCPVIWSYGGARGVTNSGLKWVKDRSNNAHIYGYNGTSTEVNIPSVIGEYNVTTIKERAFRDNKTIKSIVIPSSVTSIDSYAFSGCTSLTIYAEAISEPSDWKYSWNGSYRPVVWNYGGQHGTLASGLIWALDKSNNAVICGYDGVNAQIDIPDQIDSHSVTTISCNAFYEQESISSITIPASVTSLSTNVFCGCTALTIYAEASSKPSDWYREWNTSHCPVVWNYGGKHGTLASGLQWALDIGNNVVICGYNGNDIQVIIPNQIEGHNVTAISTSAFSNKKTINTITVPSTITSIGDYAFYNCGALTNIIIPISVTKIGEYAFKDCTALTIYAEATSKPSNWNYYWNSTNCPVIWGYTSV